MSLFEEYLTRGQWLTEEERLALYKFLLKTQKVRYNTSVRKLLAEKSFSNTFANGDLHYSLKLNSITYEARKMGADEYVSNIRSLKLSKLTFLNRGRIRKFFAQCEIDVLRNYPIPGAFPIEERSFGINVYPFYDPNYYSRGKGVVVGLLKKMQNKDDELLRQLLIS